MKSVIFLMALSFITSTAYAGCTSSTGPGYVYVWGSCVMDDRSEPDNICEYKRGTKRPKKSIVGFYQPPRYIKEYSSKARNRFFNMVQIQYDVTENGQESFCYDTFEEAQEKFLDLIADHKRSDYLIRIIR